MSNEFLAEFLTQMLEVSEEAASAMPRRAVARPRDPFEMADAAFKKNFRLTKELVRQLIAELEPVQRNETTTYDLETKVLCALHYFGHGSYQTPVGQHIALHMSQPSVSRCIAEIVEALNHPSIFGAWVKFPSSLQELNTIVTDFYRIYGFPGIIGCLDCTHVAIVPPDSTQYDERSYVNRKNYHSVNTQLICDANLRILNVNALFPGSTHDCHIWNNSNVLPLLQRLHSNGHKNYHLLGDSGYALRPWCLTPLSNPPPNTAEFNFNESLKKARCCIERCNGVLKGRFRCLIKHRVQHYAPNKATKIINACVVLHNMCIRANLGDPDISDLDEEALGIIPATPLNNTMGGGNRRTNELLVEARTKQINITNNYFH